MVYPRPEGIRTAHSRCAAGTTGVSGSGMMVLFAATGLDAGPGILALRAVTPPAESGVASNGRTIAEIIRRSACEGDFMCAAISRAPTILQGVAARSPFTNAHS